MAHPAAYIHFRTAGRESELWRGFAQVLGETVTFGSHVNAELKIRDVPSICCTLKLADMTLRADTELPIVVLNPREAPLTLVRGDQAVKLRQGSMITVGPRQYLIETSASAVSWQPQDSRLVNYQPTPRKTRYKGTLRARLLAQLEDHDEADVPPTATLVVPSARPLARTTSVEMPPADAPMDVDDDPTQQQRNDALVFLKPDWPFGRLRILARASDVPPAILSRPHAPATFDWAIGDAHFQLDGGEAEGMRSRSPSPPRMPRPSQADLQFATQDRARFQPSSPGCSPTQLVVSQQRGVVFHGRGLGGEYMPRIIDEEGEGEEENDLDDSAIDMQAVSMALGVVPPSQPKPVIPASQPKPIIAPIVPLSQPKPVIQPAAPSSPLPLLPTKKRAKVLVKKDGVLPSLVRRLNGGQAFAGPDLPLKPTAGPRRKRLGTSGRNSATPESSAEVVDGMDEDGPSVRPLGKKRPLMAEDGWDYEERSGAQLGSDPAPVVWSD